MPKYTSFKTFSAQNLKYKSNFFSTQKAVVMGILNITDDSFYDGGENNNDDKIIKKCRTMLEEGASIIDIGAQSSRPGASKISSKQELKKLLPVIKLLKNRFTKITISIDTYSSNVAEECVKAGADIINDISAGELDPQMLDVIAELKVPYIIMHMQGDPQNMQNNPSYTDIINDILLFFTHKIKQLKKKGISDIVIDPGFGFGKNIEHNYKILNKLSEFKKYNTPILIGTSRKSMIYNLLDCSPKEALNGTTITNTIALQNGANILRVHDVKEAIECVKITTFAEKNK